MERPGLATPVATEDPHRNAQVSTDRNSGAGQDRGSEGGDAATAPTRRVAATDTDLYHPRVVYLVGSPARPLAAEILIGDKTTSEVAAELVRALGPVLALELARAIVKLGDPL